MSFVAELDDRPRYVRRGSTGRLAHWPTVSGVGRVAVEAAPAPAAIVYSPAGEELDANPTVTRETIALPSGAQVSRLVVTVDATDSETYKLDEHYRVELSWTYAGVVEKAEFRFGVARIPYEHGLTMQDLVGEVPNARQKLESQRKQAGDGRTLEQHVSVLGVKSWSDVHAMISERLAQDGQVYPRLILDASRVHRVVIAQAIYRMFRGEAGREGGRAQERAQDWRQEVGVRLSQLGELKYDSDDDGIGDKKTASFSTRQMERSWRR